MTRKTLSLLLLPFLLTSCFSPSRLLNPHLDFSIQDKYIKSLPLTFAPLSVEEIKEPWGHEMKLGHLFTEKLDLYAAITALKRARLLVPEENLSRIHEIDYGILYCYYLGKKYSDVTDTFEESSLAQVTSSFPAFHDLLIILCESYLKNKELERAALMLQTLQKFFPEEGRKMALAVAVLRADLETVDLLASTTNTTEPPLPEEISTVSYQENCSRKPALLEEYVVVQESLKTLTSTFQKEKKHPQAASILNALIPGAGYLYLGQKQSAFTALCLNSLFIGASYYFYHENNLPAAIITSGFELGWYLGGIVGAKEAALLYNERLYETKAHPTLRSHKLYPLLQLQYGF